MYIYSFEKLEVWNLSRKLTVDIYQLTADFPDDEKFGLITQMRRASLSICANLSEGNSRRTIPDKIRFFNISYSSIVELLNHTIIALDLNFLTDINYKIIRDQIEIITFKINSLINSQNK